MGRDLADLSSKGFAGQVGFGRRPALIVVDFINGFTDPASPLGADVGPEIAQTNRLIQTARSNAIPIYFSTIRYEAADAADAGVWGIKIAGLKALVADGHGSRLDARLHATPQDIVVVKRFASCFFGTDLAAGLSAGGIDTLIIAGCTTSGCVRATAVDACQHGFHTIVARDAVGDRLAAAHAQSLIDIDLKYGDVLGVDAIIGALERLRESSSGGIAVEGKRR